MKIVPKNWREFQHYKDRNPPWIRLHRKLLDNQDFNALPPIACKVLVLLWLVAAESPDGVFDDDAAALAFRLRMATKDVQQALAALKAKRFFVPAGADVAESDGRPLSQQIAARNGFGSRHISDKTKRAVWERDGGKCCTCGATEELEFDHKTPVSKGGTSEPENVQLLCRPCNRRKRTKTAEQVARQAQPWLSIRTTETEAETEAFTESETDSEAETGSGLPPVGSKPSRQKTPGAMAWDAYATAYEGRYQAAPVRNKTVNGQMATFAGKIPAEEAPLVAAFYVGHQNAFYVRQMHPVWVLVRDAEKLRTEWFTNRQMTGTQAIQMDRTQTNLNTFGALIAEAKAKEARGGNLEAA